MSLYQSLKERGFIYQCTDEDALPKLLDKENISLYIGFDPTADSLHVGNMLQIILLKHFQNHGHKPIALVGGGTGLIGDPSGKTEARKLLDEDGMKQNLDGLHQDLGRILDMSPDKAQMVNNADWLRDINYIDFLRDVGRHFSVNRMLTAESVKLRLEKGLSFLEFNYQLLQAYDFWVLQQQHGVRLQCGASDQWGNIVAGIDLIRRLSFEHQKQEIECYGLTTPLLTSSSGVKMGKSVSGAVWMNPDKTSVYDFYQFWVNTEDPDVVRFLKLYTFLTMEEIAELEKLQGADIRQAKQRLAFEVTKLVHGEEEANKVQQAAQAAFGQGDDVSNLPTIEIAASELGSFSDLFLKAELCQSRSDFRRLVQGKGARQGDQVIEHWDDSVEQSMFDDGALIIRAGKKRVCRVLLS